MKKRFFDFYLKFYSKFRKLFRCTVGEHRYKLSEDHLSECCEDCHYSIPHVHIPQWTGIKKYSGPARMGRFALLPHQWLFEGNCTVCNVPLEKWDAIPLVSQKLTSLLDFRLTKESMDQMVKEFNFR